MNRREEFWYMDCEFLDALDKLGNDCAWIVLHFGKDEENCTEVVPIIIEPPPNETWRQN